MQLSSNNAPAASLTSATNTRNVLSLALSAPANPRVVLVRRNAPVKDTLPKMLKSGSLPTPELQELQYHEEPYITSIIQLILDGNSLKVEDEANMCESGRSTTSSNLLERSRLHQMQHKTWLQASTEIT